MDTLAGYLATLCVGAVGTYLAQFLRPKIKIRYWYPHIFTYTIPNLQAQMNPANPALPAPAAGGATAPAVPAAQAHFYLLSQSITIQNFGRETAAWIEVAHNRKPDFFQLYPTLAYTESVSVTGEHTLRVQSLAPGEFLTIQFLAYTHAPQLSFIRSNAGQAKVMPWTTVRKYPQWFYLLLWLLLLIGGAFCAYWLIKAGTFVFKNVL